MIEQTYRRVVRNVVKQVSIPVSVKIGPYFTALPNLARQLAKANVSGLVLFNRFYQPDFDLNNLDVVSSLVFSRSEEMRLPLTWTAILYGQVSLDLAISTGVHTYVDVIKAMMAGAQVAMIASEMLENGTRRVGEILKDVREWMEEREYASIDQMRGSMSRKNVPDSAAFERANYIKVLHSFRFVPN
jgi:dihydroorotate dehydrogenase (fumarate)